MNKDLESFQEILRHLIPLNELSENDRTQLFNKAELISLKKNKFLFQQGDKDAYSFYLLDGKLQLLANNELHNTIDANTDRSRYPLAQLQPRQFSAKAISPVQALRLDREAVDRALVLANSSNQQQESVPESNTDLEVSEIEQEEDIDWMTRMLQSELFAQIPTGNIHQLFALLEPIEYEPGDIVITQGEPGEHYYIVSEGKCIVSRKASASAKEVTLATLSAGDSFGEEALLTETTRNATVRMKTAGTLMRLEKDSFISLIMEPGVKGVDVHNAQQLVHQGAVWLDVRFKSEYENASIAGSKHIPLNLLRLESEKLDLNKTYITYCDTGGRSSAAAFVLADRGIKVCYLKGGLISNPGLAQEAATAKPSDEAVSTSAGNNISRESNAPEAKPPTAGLNQTDTRKADPQELAEKTIAPKADTENAVSEAVTNNKTDTDGSANKEVNINEVDPDIKASALETELERTNFKLQEIERLRSEVAAAERKKAQEQLRQKLEEEKTKLEQERIKAQQESELQRQKEQEKIEAIKQRKEQELRQEKLKLEEIYNKNAEEMAKIEEMKKQAEQEALAVKQQFEQQQKEVERLRLEAEEKARDEQQRAKKESEEAKKLLQETQRMREEMEQQAKREAQQNAQRLAEEQQHAERMKAEAEEKARLEKERLEKETSDARKMLEEAQRMKEEMEQSRQRMEDEVQQKMKLQEQMEERLQQEMKSRLDAERRKLAEQLKLNNQELENAQKEKLAAEAARKAAQHEASKIIEEYKAEQETLQQQQEQRLQAEKSRLNQETAKIRSSLNKLKHEKEQAEEDKEKANLLIADLKKREQEKSALADKALQEKIQQEIRAAESKVKTSETQLKIVNEAEKKANAAAQMNEEDVARNKEQLQRMESQLNDELEEFTRELEQREQELAAKAAAQSQMDLVRIQQKAEEAKEKAREHDFDLLADIASQLKD